MSLQSIIIIFFISFKGFFPLTIPECPIKPEVDQESPSLNEVKETLELKGFVLINTNTMKKLLIQQGANEEDISDMESGNIHKNLPIISSRSCITDR